MSRVTMAVLTAALASVTAPTRAACTVGRLAELPVTMTGLRPLVPAKINGVEANFIADSGAFYSLISPASAAQLHLPLRLAPFNFRLAGVGGEALASITTVKTFTLAGVPIPNVEFLVAGGDSGASAVGLLGQNVLRLADVEYDLGHAAIRLMRPHDCDRTDMAYWVGPGRAFSVVKIDRTDDRSPYTVTTVLVNGVGVRAMFDTGAATSVLDLAAARRAGIRVDGPGVKPAGFSGGIGRKLVKTWIAPVATFKLGDEQIQNSHLRIGDISLNAAEMLIGADFFLSHRVYVANGQHKLYVTYEGGPVFNLEAARAGAPDGAPGVATTLDPEKASTDQPTDADAYGRRGAARAARREYAGAVEDFTQALALAPERPDFAFRRGLAHMSLGQPFLAMADLDTAVKLKPDDVEARLARAELRLHGRDQAGARADLDAAAAAAPKQADLRLRLAGLYSAMDAFDPALAQFDLWIESHGQDSRLGVAMNGRCWVRGLANRELDRALSDCNAAVRLPSPNAAAALDNRGLVHLRRGEFDRAIADYDAALKLRPQDPWSLYGRGLAKVRTGRAEEGRADLAAAAKLAPKLAERAAKFGLRP